MWKILLEKLDEQSLKLKLLVVQDQHKVERKAILAHESDFLDENEAIVRSGAESIWAWKVSTKHT